MSLAMTIPFKKIIMKNQTLNLFIIEDVPEKSLRLHLFLANRFGTIFNIFTFTDPVTALSNINENTSIVVLDYDYFGEEGNYVHLLTGIDSVNIFNSPLDMFQSDASVKLSCSHLLDSKVQLLVLTESARRGAIPD
jgi:hypothetical protein